MPSLAVVAGALLLSLGSAAPPRAPARGGIKLSSCPRGGSRPAAAHDDSEAGIETFARDYEITTSYENGSTGAGDHGEAQHLSISVPGTACCAEKGLYPHVTAVVYRARTYLPLPLDLLRRGPAPRSPARRARPPRPTSDSTTSTK